MTRLEAEYRGADEVLLALVAFEMRRAATGSGTAAQPPAPVAEAAHDAFRQVIGW